MSLVKSFDKDQPLARESSCAMQARSTWRVSDVDQHRQVKHRYRGSTTRRRDENRCRAEKGVGIRAASVERAIRPSLSVVGIGNQITLKPRPMPADITERITSALQRQALHEEKRNH